MVPSLPPVRVTTTMALVPSSATVKVGRPNCTVCGWAKATAGSIRSSASLMKCLRGASFISLRGNIFAQAEELVAGTRRQVHPQTASAGHGRIGHLCPRRVRGQRIRAFQNIARRRIGPGNPDFAVVEHDL